MLTGLCLARVTVKGCKGWEAFNVCACMCVCMCVFVPMNIHEYVWETRGEQQILSTAFPFLFSCPDKMPWKKEILSGKKGLLQITVPGSSPWKWEVTEAGVEGSHSYGIHDWGLRATEIYVCCAQLTLSSFMPFEIQTGESCCSLLDWFFPD